MCVGSRPVVGRVVGPVLFLGSVQRWKSDGVVPWLLSASQSCQNSVSNYREKQKITTLLPTVTLELGLTLTERQSDLITQSLKRLGQ